MDVSEYRERFTPGESAPGWEAIDRAVEPLYPGQKPKHYAATPHQSLGGKDPIDGVSFYNADYEGRPYTHVVTYGFSELYYDENSVGKDFSKAGFELTFRVAPFGDEPDGPTWAFGLIQNLARYVFGSKTWFAPGHHIDANGPIRIDVDTKLTALGFLEDPQLGTIDTVHGSVQFVQMFGLTSKEFEMASGGTQISEILEPHREANPLLITDLARGDL